MAGIPASIRTYSHRFVAGSVVFDARTTPNGVTRRAELTCCVHQNPQSGREVETKEASSHAQVGQGKELVFKQAMKSNTL